MCYFTELVTVKNSGVRVQSSPSPPPQLVIPGLELLMDQIQASMEATDEEESSDGDLTKDMKVFYFFVSDPANSSLNKIDAK